MSRSPATPDKASKLATESSPNVAMPFIEKLTSTSKVKQASLNEPSPASTYGDTVGSSCPATPQEVGGRDLVAGLANSLRAVQIDPAIKSISGSPMVGQADKSYSQAEGIAITSCASSTKSSPSSDRLKAIRSSPNWRNHVSDLNLLSGLSAVSGASFVRQSANQSDDPFVSNGGARQSPDRNGTSFSPRPDRAGVALTNDNAQALLPPHACVFVANLTQTQTDDQLEHHVRDAFGQFGNCYVKIRRDPNGMPFAFVQYETEDEAQRAIAMGRGMLITGRPCRTEVAKVNRSLYMSRVTGGHISVDEAVGVLHQYGKIEETWYAMPTEKEIYRLPEGIWVRFAYFQDCRDAQAGFRDHAIYRLEQPPVPDNLRTRHGRQQRGLPTNMGVSPTQGRSPGRMLPSPMRRGVTDMCSIFVGGLPPNATQDRLREMFQVYGQILHIELIQKPSVNINGYNTFAFVEYLSPDMATAAVQASPRVYGSDRLRVERKESIDPFARRDNFGGSPRNAYYSAPQDMALLFQRGVYAGMAQAAQVQAMPPPVYAAYPPTYYGAYDPSQYNQYTSSAASVGQYATAAAPVNQYTAPTAPINHYTTPAASTDNNIAASLQGPGHFQFGPSAQASASSMGNFHYPAHVPPPAHFAEPPSIPAGSGYQWPPAASNNNDANAPTSHESQ